MKLAKDVRIQYNLQCLQVLLGDRINERPIKPGWFSLATKAQAQAILRDDPSENEIRDKYKYKHKHNHPNLPMYLDEGYSVSSVFVGQIAFPIVAAQMKA